MFSKQLFTALSLLVLAASSALAAVPLQCPAASTVTVAATASISSAAATNIVVGSSSVISSAAASATSSSSSKGKGGKDKGGNERNGKGNNNGKGKGGNNGGAKGSTTSSVVSAAASGSAAASSAASLTQSIAASSSAFDSSAASSTATLAVGGGDKGVGGTGLASSAVSSSAVASASATSGSATSGDEQSATTLNPAVIATGFALDGQQVPTAGQVASLTSTNNFINFCLTVNKPITNGQQIKTGSCNPAPMGVIAAITNMPSSKFVSPKNGDTIKANTAFTISMAISNLEAGNFVNAASNYYSAPQQVNSAGNIIGHSHVVIEQLTSLNQTTPNDPNKFAFFKGINGAAVNGVITADVTDGLPAGAYRMASINAAANHQPVLVAVAQHGSLDDMVYFTVN